MEAPRIARQGNIDQLYLPKSTEIRAKEVPRGEAIVLPKVGHGFSVPKSPMPQFKQAFFRVATVAGKPSAPTWTESGADPQSLSDLPLDEVPAAGGNANWMGVIITGDGGWGVTDSGIAKSLAARGIPVVGLNSLHYFWKQKTPEQAAADLNRILEHYSALWKRTTVVIIGYSFGADVLPFMLNRLPGDSLQKIKVIALLGPGSTADFEFHLTDWITTRKRATSQMVRPEVEKLRGRKILCFYGTEDDDELCRQLDAGLAKTIPIPGGHRFGRDYQPIVDAVLQAIQ